MKEYLNKIICGDCLDILPKLPDNLVDLVLTDPPFEKDIIKSIIPKLFRVTKEEGSIIMFIFPDHIWYIDKPTRQICVWEETYCPQGRRGKRYRRFFDLILWWTKSEDYTFNNLYRYQERGIFNDSFEDYDEKKHQWQKPVSLIKKLIKIHSNSNDLVLDPFLGSGTTAVACKKLKRNFIGIEISEKYCEIARQRLRQ